MKNCYSKLFVKHKEILIPYGGSCVAANGFMNPRILLDMIVYPSKSWLVDKSNAHYLTEDEDFKTLQTNKGQVFITSPIGLIFVVEVLSNHFSYKDFRNEAQLDHWRFLKPDVLIKSLQEKQFLQYVPSDSIAFLSRYTEERVSEEKERVVRLRRESDNKAKEALERLNVTVTQESLKAVLEIKRFDVSYDYSDDHRMVRRYREYEARFRQELRQLNMEHVLDDHIRTFWDNSRT